MPTSTCHVSQLPEDMQVLISDFVEDSLGAEGLEQLSLHQFQLYSLPLVVFPRVGMWTDYRDRAYSEAMIGQKVPPIVLCNGHWLDGRNRVWAARESGQATVKCIDLSEVGVTVRFPQLGKLYA
jgi:hypothetical protein